MISEFYIRHETDPYYKPNVLETNREDEALVNQVKVTLGTTRASVLGEAGFGMNLIDFLYQFDVNPQSVSTEMNDQVSLFSELARIHNITFDVKKVRTFDDKVALLADMRVNGKNVLGFLV